MGRPRKPSNEPEIINRKARYRYAIGDTLEVGIVLTGTEVKSIRVGKISIAEGYVRAQADPPLLTLHASHVEPYPPAGDSSAQHEPTRTRRLLAHTREIRKLAHQTQEQGVTLVPLKVYFKSGRAKMLIGVARGKGKTDRREDVKKREAQRDMRRAMSRRM